MLIKEGESQFMLPSAALSLEVCFFWTHGVFTKSLKEWLSMSISDVSETVPKCP